MQRFESGDQRCDRGARALPRRRAEHGAEYFADGSNVVLRDPVSELEQGASSTGEESRTWRRFCCDLRLAIMQFNDDSGKPLFAKWNEHASADYGNVSVYAIGENDVERYGNRDVAELRLSRHAENMLQVGSYG